MKKIALCASSFVALTFALPSQAANNFSCSGGAYSVRGAQTFVGQALGEMGIFGIPDGTIQLSATVGSDNFTMSASSLENANNQLETAFGVTPGDVGHCGSLGYFASTYFPDLVGINFKVLNASQYFQAGTPLFANYANLTFSIDGVAISATLPANSNTLTFAISNSNVVKVFTGTSRDAVQAQFVNWIESNRSVLLNDIEYAIRAQSVTDPVAGNPNSLVSVMAKSDFDAGGGAGEDEDLGPDSHVDNSLTFSPEPERFTVDGANGYVIYLPIKYTYYFDDPRYALTVDFPLTYVDWGGGNNSYSGSLGIAMRLPALKNWYVTPSFRVGAVGETGMGGAAYGAALYSFALTSKYNVYHDDWKFSLNDQIGYYSAFDVRIGDVLLAPNVSNVVYKNGVSAEHPTSAILFDSPTSWSASIVDTHIAGTATRIAQWEELGVDFGTRQTEGSGAWNVFRLGLGFAFGEAGYRAYELTATARF